MLKTVNELKETLEKLDELNEVYEKVREGLSGTINIVPMSDETTYLNSRVYFKYDKELLLKYLDEEITSTNIKLNHIMDTFRGFM